MTATTPTPTAPAPTTPAPTFDAATVILMRPVTPAADPKSEPRGEFEVLLLQRHTRSRFMPGAYVYPGGRLDPIDLDPRVQTQTTGRTHESCVKALQEPHTDGALAMGLFTAALRESYEEAGVLLVRRTDGGDASLPLDWLKNQRKAVHDDHERWPALLETQGLVLDLGSVYPIAHWITPEFEPRRFDTRFFVALCPEWQREALSHDARETIDSCWLTPADALTKHASGGLMLPPPTFRTMETLAVLGTIEAVLAALPTLAIPTIQPVHNHDEDTLNIILPGDPVHPLPIQGDKGPKRVVLRGDHWVSVW